MAAVTFSGFNQIDWNSVLNAVMKQERRPLTALQTQKTALSSQKDAFATLATKLATVDDAAGSLADARAFAGRIAAASDPTALGVVAGGDTPAGSYDVVVNRLARSQVTVSDTTYADKDTTIVASGGTLSIGGATVTITGDTTLQGLADAINSAAGVPATATIVRAGGQYQMVLTGRQTGRENAFTVANGLTGGIAFSATNAMEASDADLLVNNVHVTSATNSIDGAIPGATLSLLEERAAPVTVTVGRDLSSVESAMQAFVDAYNDLVGFLDEENASAARGDGASIARDSVTRSLRGALRDRLTRQYGSGGAFQYLSQIGVGFTRTGKLSLDKTALGAAAVNPADLQGLVSGSAGVFGAIQSIVGDYVDSDGLVPGAATRLGDQMERLDSRIASLEARLALRQQSLQQEYAAADRAMSQLNSQAGSLASLSSQYQSF
jgi:flagellar hook-associated protein 2